MVFAITDVDTDESIQDGQEEVQVTLSGTVAATGKRVYLSQGSDTVEQQVVAESAGGLTFNCDYGGVLSPGSCTIIVTSPEPVTGEPDGVLMWTGNWETGSFTLNSQSNANDTFGGLPSGNAGIQMEVVTTPVRSGNYALKMSVVRDNFLPGGQWEGLTPRCQGNKFVQTVPHVEQNVEWWFGLSIYCPTDHQYDINGTNEGWDMTGQIVWQMKGTGNAMGSSPPVALTYYDVDDTIRIGRRYGDKSAPGGVTHILRPLLTMSDKLGEWLDIVVRLIVSAEETGVLQVWLDGELAINDVDVITTYWDVVNDPTDWWYFNFGPYKPKWVMGGSTAHNDRVFYYDNIRCFMGTNGYTVVDPAQDDPL